MDSLTITVPDTDVKNYVDGLVSRGDYSSADDYVLTLIREDKERRAKARLEALLLEGLEGEPIELTDEVWDEMRREFLERHPEADLP